MTGSPPRPPLSTSSAGLLRKSASDFAPSDSAIFKPACSASASLRIGVIERPNHAPLCPDARWNKPFASGDAMRFEMLEDPEPHGVTAGERLVPARIRA